jgi:hypothetical protein
MVLSIHSAEITLSVPPSWIFASVEAEGVRFEPGDICIVRTGLTETFLALSEDEYVEMLSKPRESAGVQQGEDMYRWHWEKGIAAVASDT